jgi:hypothetical protein
MRSQAGDLSSESPIGSEPAHGAGALSTLSPVGSEPAGGFDEAGAWIWPQTVRDSKTRIDAAMTATRADIAACAALAATDKSAFETFFTSWRDFYCGDQLGTCSEPYVSVWGLGSQQDQCDSFQAQLTEWQKKLATTNCLSGPALPTPPTGPDLSAVKWLAIALAIGAGLYVVNQTGLPRLFPRKGRGK